MADSAAIRQMILTTVTAPTAAGEESVSQDEMNRIGTWLEESEMTASMFSLVMAGTLTIRWRDNEPEPNFQLTDPPPEDSGDEHIEMDSTLEAWLNETDAWDEFNEWRERKQTSE